MKRLTVSGQVCVEILGLLVAMAWADGKLDDSEKEGVRGAAKVLNLSKDLRDKLDTILENPTPFDQLLLERLGPKDRAFAFAAAAWLAGADDDIAEKERGMLDHLADRFGYSHAHRDEIVQVVRDLDPPPKSERKFGEELVRLFKALPPRVLRDDPEDDLEVVYE